MTVIAPTSSGTKHVEEIMNRVSQQQYYTVSKLPLTKLITVEFIEAFVKRGCWNSSFTICIFQNLYFYNVLLCAETSVIFFSLVTLAMDNSMRVISKVSGLNILDNNIFYNLYISETYILYNF